MKKENVYAPNSANPRVWDPVKPLFTERLGSSTVVKSGKRKEDSMKEGIMWVSETESKVSLIFWILRSSVEFLSYI